MTDSKKPLPTPKPIDTVDNILESVITGSGLPVTMTKQYPELKSALYHSLSQRMPEPDTFTEHKGAGSHQFNDYTNGWNHAIKEVNQALKGYFES